MVNKVHKAIQTMLGVWIVVAVVMLVRMHYVNLGALAPAPYDPVQSAQNYKQIQDDARILNATGQLPTDQNQR
jgi:hypothetical protein